MPEVRAVIAIDIAAETKEEARTFVKDIVRALRGTRMPHRGPKRAVVYASDLVEIRDR